MRLNAIREDEILETLAMFGSYFLQDPARFWYGLWFNNILHALFC